LELQSVRTRTAANDGPVIHRVMLRGGHKWGRILHARMAGCEVNVAPMLIEGRMGRLPAPARNRVGVRRAALRRILWLRRNMCVVIVRLCLAGELWRAAPRVQRGRQQGAARGACGRGTRARNLITVQANARQSVGAEVRGRPASSCVWPGRAERALLFSNSSNRPLVGWAQHPEEGLGPRLWAPWRKAAAMGTRGVPILRHVRVDFPTTKTFLA